MNYLLFGLLVLFLTSCATSHRFMSGTVALRIDENSGIACLESGVAKKGLKLKLLNNDCSRSPDHRGACRLVEVGEIEITKILNEHYAEFRKLFGPNFEEGSILSKTK